MPATYEPIATTTISGSSTASVTLSSIPSTYTDLVLIINGGTTGADLYLRVNGDAGSNYSQTILLGTGSSAGSVRYSNNDRFYIDYYGITANVFSVASTVQFLNYSNTSTNKTSLTRHNQASISTEASVNLWRSTSAINSVTVLTGTFLLNGTTVSLYGIKAA